MRVEGILTLLILFTIQVALSQNRTIDSLKNSLTTRNGSDRIELLLDLSNRLYSSNTSESRGYARQALKLASLAKNNEAINAALRLIGITYDIEGVKDSSKYYFERFFDQSTSANDQKAIAAALNNLGMWHWNAGLFDKALEYFFKTIRASETSESLEVLAKAYNNIGLIYQELDNYAKARVYNLKAYELRKANNWETGIIHSCNNLGICYKSIGLLDSARFYYLTGLEYAVKLNNEVAISSIYQNLGVIASLRGDLKEALHLVNKSLEYNGAAVGKLLSYSTLSEIYHKKGDARKSVGNGLKALAIADNMNNLGHHKDIYQNLANAYVLSNDLDSANHYYKRLLQLKDRIFSEQSAKTYNDLELKYETDKKEQQIALQTAEIKSKDLIIQRNTFLVIGLSIILSLGVLIFYLWRKKSRARQAIVIQEQKVRMREAQIKSVIQSQEEERQRFATDLHDGIGQLINTIQLNINGLRNQKNNEIEKRVELYENSSQLLSDMNQEIRNIAFNLMPQILIKEGLSSALNELSRRINQSGELILKIHHQEGDKRLGEVMEISLYRIIQELISNIIKYAKAKTIFIQFTADENEMTLTIEDDGEGFDTMLFKNGKGNGWRNINSRLNLIKSEMTIDTQKGRKGSTVIIDIPIPGKVLSIH